MGKYIFKTNVNCIGCVSQIKPHLDKLEQDGLIKHWQVHPTDPDHLLEIESNRMDLEAVRVYVENAGFKAEPRQNV
ncbi:MAG: hypothetical protein M3Q06_05425 [Bacteroidota bacterium]|nr:hypothetical protein [Bacteroidota bacterium]